MKEFENLNFLNEGKYQNMTLEEKQEWLDKFLEYWDDEEKIKKVPRNEEDGKFISEYGRFFSNVMSERRLIDSKLEKKRFETDPIYRAEKEKEREEWRKNYKERFTTKEKREITKEWLGYFPDMGMINIYSIGRFIGPFLIRIHMRTTTIGGAGYRPSIYALSFACEDYTPGTCDYGTNEVTINYNTSEEEKIRWLNYIKRTFSYRTEGEFTLDDIRAAYWADYKMRQKEKADDDWVPDQMMFIASWAGELAKAEEYLNNMYGKGGVSAKHNENYFKNKLKEDWLKARDWIIKHNQPYIIQPAISSNNLYDIRINPSDLDQENKMMEQLSDIYDKVIEDSNLGLLSIKNRIWNIIKDPELVRQMARENFKIYKTRRPSDVIENANIQPIKGARYQGTILD